MTQGGTDVWRTLTTLQRTTLYCPGVVKWRCEPLAIAAGVQALVGSALVVLIAYNIWTPTETQRNSIDQLLIAFWGLVLMFVRGMVTPTANVGLTKTDIELIEAAKREV